MRPVEPKVYLIGRPSLNLVGIYDYLETVGGLSWFTSRFIPNYRDGGWSKPEQVGSTLTEFMGRLCYRSWEPGLNPNVTKIREDQAKYLANVLNSQHGSVLEHAVYNFVISYGSRIFTHEHVRHRAGTAISQESMRYVRLDDLPIWLPDWFKEDPANSDALALVLQLVHHAEDVQKALAEHFDLDEEGKSFAEKKAMTSFMRRWSPAGVATHTGWSANVRALRWIIQQRTELGAEEEIRLVLDQVAKIMVLEEPMLFQDFEVNESGSWVPINRKV